MEEKPVFMLAEDNGPEIHQAFDASYNWEIHHCLNDIAQGKKNADSLIDIWEQKASKFKDGDIWLNFTSNHDENSWSGSEYERMGHYAEMMAALTYCLPGMPLTYSGQEAANKKALRFFDKDTIDFSDTPLKDFYARWNGYKNHHPISSNKVNFVRQNPNGLMFRIPELESITYVFNFGDDTTINLDGKYRQNSTMEEFSGDTRVAKYQYLILFK